MYVIAVDTGSLATTTTMFERGERVVRIINEERETSLSLRSLVKEARKRNLMEPAEVIINMIPRQIVRGLQLFMRRARGALPMRWGTYQGAF